MSHTNSVHNGQTSLNMDWERSVSIDYTVRLILGAYIDLSAEMSSIQELDKASPRNWLDDNIWLKKAYHEWRAPLLVNSNWWLAFYNDTSVPSHALISPKPVGAAGITPWQVRRAAWLVYRTLEFKDKLEQYVCSYHSPPGLIMFHDLELTYLRYDCRQELYPDTTRTGTHDIAQSRLITLDRSKHIQVYGLEKTPSVHSTPAAYPKCTAMPSAPILLHLRPTPAKSL